MSTKIIPWQPDAETDELIRLYVEQTGREYHVCAAFVMADREPPGRNRIGLGGSEINLVEEHYDRYDPHGERAQTAKLKAKLDEVD